MSSKGENKSKVIETTFYRDLDIIAEIVFDPYLQPEIQFALIDKVRKQIIYRPELNLTDGTVIKPLNNSLVREGKLLLPSSADEYISEEKLIKDLEEFIYTYLDLPHPFYLKLVSHYVLMDWVYDKLTVVPYLRALGDYGSGKTRFAQVVGSICYKPLFLAGATSDAFIFRMIELFKGTLVINELERVNSDLQSQLVVILNNGYEKGLYIGRVEGDRVREPKVFDVFCPKIITSRTKFKDLALESRILSIPMKPTTRHDIPPLLDETFWEKAQRLRNQLLMYRFKNLNLPQFEDKSPKLAGLEPRLKQTLIPIFSVIQDEGVEQEFIKYAQEFQENIYSERSFEIEALIAEKLVDLIDLNDKVSIREVKEKLDQELDEKERITSKTIGSKIRGFGFKTKKVQGKFEIILNPTVTQYLKERYGLDKQSSDQSLPSPQSLPPDSASSVDLVDKVDIKKPLDQLTRDEQLKIGEEVFGEGAKWAEGEVSNDYS